MTDLTEFLLARISEDEAVARAVGQEDPWTPQSLRYHHDFDSAVGEGVDPPFAWTASDEVAAHIARWDPARVLAECEAKRGIVEHYRRAVEAVDSDKRRVMAGGYPHPQAAVLGDRDVSTLEPVVRLLALPYADHPDYREEWRP